MHRSGLAIRAALSLALLASPGLTTPADAAPTGTPAFALDWFTVDGGGAHSSGAAFVVEGTVGQFDADPTQPSTAAAFALSGGFWGAAIVPPAPSEGVFSDGFED